MHLAEPRTFSIKLFADDESNLSLIKEKFGLINEAEAIRVALKQLADEIAADKEAKKA